MSMRSLFTAATLIGVLVLGACAGDTAQPPQAGANAPAQRVKLQLVRNATIKLFNYGDSTFLVDPMLAPKDAYPGFPGTPRSHLRNPLVDLPMPVDEVLQADAVILTHLHEDHWDLAARNLVRRDMPIFVQNEEDAAKVRHDGFTDVRVLSEQGTDFRGTRLIRVRGQHGGPRFYAIPQLAEILGKTMGVVFQRDNHPTAYVAGDSIWTEDVETALTAYKPQILVLNTGFAQVEGMEGSIIMGKDDVLRAYRFAPQAKIVAVHMESVNHAMLTRKALREFIATQGLDKQRVLVPEDGEVYTF